MVLSSVLVLRFGARCGAVLSVGRGNVRCVGQAVGAGPCFPGRGVL